MSYCRFESESDVYMYESVRGYIECCWCRFDNGGDRCPHFYSRADALSHLFKHLSVGHRVPYYAIEELQSEIAAGYDVGNGK